MRCVSVLLAYGTAGKCGMGREGRTALAEAVRRRSEDLTRLIAKKEPAWMNVADSRGWFPLHYAVAAGDIPAVVFLLNCAAPLSGEAVTDLEEAMQAAPRTLHSVYEALAPVIQGQLQFINVGKMVKIVMKMRMKMRMKMIVIVMILITLLTLIH